MKICYGVILALLMSGCSFLSKPLPDWWVHQPVDSSQWLYGVGEGDTVDQAQQQALVAIAGKLQTDLSSQIAIQTQETTQYYDQFALRNIRASVQNTNLSHFQVVETAKSPDSDRQRVLVKVDRPALEQAWRNQYQALSKQVTSAMVQGKAQSRFDWWLKAQQARETARKADTLALQIAALTDQPAASSLLDKLNQKLRDTPLSATVKGDNATIDQQIADLLNQQDLRVNACSQCDVTFNYYTKVEFKKIFGQLVATLNFYGELRDSSGLVGQQHWVVQGASIANKSNALKGASIHAAQYIEKQGLWSSFGLKQ